MTDAIHDSRFLSYFGNHHKLLAPSNIKRLGMVSFAKHFGKPLTAELWEDLTERLCANQILIYRHNAEMWTLGWWPGTCIIHLDAAGMVADIEWAPREPLAGNGPLNYQSRQAYGVMSQSIIDNVMVEP